MASLKFRTPYNKPKQHEYAFATEGDSLTQQHHQQECDINFILAKYKKNNLVTHLAKGTPTFGDFSNPTDYHSALDKLIRAQQDFDALPSDIRSQFANDPSKLIEFLADTNNDEEAIKMGFKKYPEKTLSEELETALENNDKKRNATKTPPPSNT